MSAEMFSATNDTTQYAVGSRKWYTLPLSILVHTLALASAIVVPVVAATVILPTPQQQLVHMMAEVVKPPAVPRVEARPVVTLSPEINAAAAPVSAPEGIAEESIAPVVNINGTRPVLLQRAASSTGLAAPPQPQVPSEPIRPGGQILPPRKIHDVAPEYPAIARAARSSGIVIIEAVIDREGRVRDARVLRSAHLLDDAALAAVRQWLYTPTRLNGEPVEVVMTVTVRFQIN